MTPDQLVTLLGACFLVIGFIVLLRLLKLVDHVRGAGQVSRNALNVLSDAALDDDAKEKAMQKNAIELFKRFALLAFGGTVAVLGPASILWGIDRFGWLSLEAIIELTLSWEFLVSATVVGIGVMMIPRRNRAKPETAFENRYSGIDRLLHQVAFASRPAQVMLSGLEDKIFNKRLITSSVAPVFIAALPRTGTTLLLELCHQLPEFASHTYRHMPFVMSPLFWGRFAAAFKTVDVARERAHGDGMLVSLDSPEAFEEMLWMQFWPGNYQGGRITPWSTEPASEFDTFFKQHRDKIVLLAATPDGIPPRRYISKNNLNIARVARLAALIPDSRIVLPFRDPYQHAESLLRQHLNFTKIHERDPFSRTYMAGIGHFDFGANLKPVNFGNWLEKTDHKDPTQLSFWLSYWEATYTYLLAHASDRVRFSDFDALCADPIPALERLTNYIRIEDKQRFRSQFTRIRPLCDRDVDMGNIDQAWRIRIANLVARLKEKSL